MFLARSDRYETSEGRTRTLLSRFSPWPELAFYLPVLRIVFSASFQACLGRYDGERWVASSLRVVRAMEGVGMRLRIEGMDHLRSLDGPCVFVSNHMSTLETFVLPGIVHPLRPVTFIVKESLLRYPVFGPILRSRNPIGVGRRNPREDLAAVLTGGEERLKDGISLIVFPQTTRSDVFSLDRFNSLGAKLAARAGVPLLPVALRSDAWGTGRLLKDFGPVHPEWPVHFRFGPPLRPTRKGSEAHDETVRFIQEALEEWGCRVARTGAGVGKSS